VVYNLTLLIWFTEEEPSKDILDTMQPINTVRRVFLDLMANGTTYDDFHAAVEEITHKIKSATQYQVTRKRSSYNFFMRFDFVFVSCE